MTSRFERILPILVVTGSLLAMAWPEQGKAQTPDQLKTVAINAEAYQRDAQALIPLIEREYAYLDRLPDSRFPHSPELEAALTGVTDQASLLAYAERVIIALADHHAITGSSFSNSWALIPTYSDLWIEKQDGEYVITAVRKASPASRAGIKNGDRITALSGLKVEEAISAFWAQTGGPVTDNRMAYSARVLAAGRRDHKRHISVVQSDGNIKNFTLDNLYEQPSTTAKVTSQSDGTALRIIIHDALGDNETIAEFDRHMAQAASGQPVILDLTETPSGGNTTVARAIMGWFTDRPQAYQAHDLPKEARQYGLERRWLEQVMPREGRYHNGPITVEVGRWTGSMGEGLAIGLNALGAEVHGDPMAGLLGAIYDLRLPNSGLIIKLPVERLFSVDGKPREAFVPTASSEASSIDAVR